MNPNNEVLGVKITFEERSPFHSKIDLWKLSKEELREWIFALESGDYKQGRSSLCSSSEFCCLGVKAKLEDRLKLIKGKNCFVGPNNISNSKSLFQHERMPPNGELPFKVSFKDSKWGLWFKEYVDLSGLNDRGMSFAQIGFVLRFLYFILFKEEISENNS